MPTGSVESCRRSRLPLSRQQRIAKSDGIHQYKESRAGRWILAAMGILARPLSATVGRQAVALPAIIVGLPLLLQPTGILQWTALLQRPLRKGVEDV